MPQQAHPKSTKTATVQVDNLDETQRYIFRVGNAVVYLVMLLPSSKMLRLCLWNHQVQAENKAGRGVYSDPSDQLVPLQAVSTGSHYTEPVAKC